MTNLLSTALSSKIKKAPAVLETPRGVTPELAGVLAIVYPCKQFNRLSCYGGNMSYTEVAMAIGELCQLFNVTPVLTAEENGILVDTNATIVKLSNEIRLLIGEERLIFNG